MTIQAIAADPDSLAANRVGQIGPEQQRRLARAVKADASVGLLLVGGFAALFATVLWAQWQSYSDSNRTDGLVGAVFLLAVCLLIFAWLYGRRAQKLAEVAAGKMEQAEGHVVWQRGDYRAQIPGRMLPLTGFNLAAGRYRFSYLPRSGRLVAAELLEADTPAEQHDELLHTLAQANHFNLDDLPALRQGNLGQISPRRLLRLWLHVGAWFGSAAVLALLFVGMVAGDVAQDVAPLFFSGAIITGIFGLFSAIGAISPTLDLLGGKVSQAEGLLGKNIRQTYGRGASTYYYYRLDKQSWLVSSEAYRALLTGRSYRLYFLPRSKTLLGIEPL